MVELFAHLCFHDFNPYMLCLAVFIWGNSTHTFSFFLHGWLITILSNLYCQLAASIYLGSINLCPCKFVSLCGRVQLGQVFSNLDVLWWLMTLVQGEWSYRRNCGPLCRKWLALCTWKSNLCKVMNRCHWRGQTWKWLVVSFSSILLLSG
jgi:hypothetical protein